MHFSLNLPIENPAQADEFIRGDAVAEIARAAEGAGFAAVNVTDHPIPEDRWLRGGGHHALDPFVVLATAAAATTRLRLHTHIVVLPYRNPFVLAKAVMTLDRLSDGRVILGAAAGYLRPEFRALGVPYDERNELADECIRALRAAWTGESFSFEGRHFQARGHTMLPTPVQSPPPIWIGGNSRRAIRRAAELGDGWVPFPNPPAQARHVKTPALQSLDALAERLALLRAFSREAGRDGSLDVCFAPLRSGAEGHDPAALLPHLEELAKLGVTWLAVGLPRTDRARFLDEIGRFGAEVIAPTGGAAAAGKMPPATPTAGASP